MKLIVATFIETGLRRSELTSLNWKDIDLERGELTVRAENAKTKSGRVIALRGDLVGKLKEWKSRYPFPTDDAPVFINQRKRRMLGDCLNSKFRKIVAASKIPPDGVDLHALRFTFCTRLVKANISMRVIQALMGHRDLRLISLYADMTLLDRHGAVEALPALQEVAQSPQVPIRRVG